MYSSMSFQSNKFLFIYLFLYSFFLSLNNNQILIKLLEKNHLIPYNVLQSHNIYENIFCNDFIN